MTTPPTILFDGVCNLCNSAVRWIIDRDEAAAFRFASLQSRAGHQAIAATGSSPASLPDSMVLILNGRVLTRSDAAIGIACLLGFPWSMARVLCIVPRVIRDGLYTWIAANRYRWFGRQSTCLIPTASIRVRFLDADETAPVVREESDLPVPVNATDLRGNASSGSRGMLFTVAHRFLLAYLFIYIVPFPVGVIPYTSWLGELFQSILRPMVLKVGEVVFGTSITVMPNGSGDTTYNYVEIFTFAFIAAISVIGWTLWRRAVPVSTRVHDVMTVYVRYCLAMYMFGYGWTKVFPNQMPLPGPDRLIGTIGDMSPMGLVWTFMGTGTAYQIFAGCAEVLAGVLLLWRRTALAGGLVAAGVLANVVALNFCFDVPVKIFSSHLLVMAIFLCLPHAARLLAVLLFNLPAAPVVLRPFPIRHRWVRRAALAAKLGFIVLIAVLPAHRDWQFMISEGLFAPTKPWHGIYRVDSFTRDGITGRELDDSTRWVRVGIDSSGLGTIQRADGTTRRQRMEIDPDKGTLTISRRDEPEGMTLTFAMPRPGCIALEGTFEGKRITALLVLTDQAPPLLTSRGFHWINEFPMNR